MVSNNGHTRRKVTGKTLFPIGTVVGTPGAARFCAKHDVHPLCIVARHASGDWGDVCPDDYQANEEALKSGARVMSVYKFGDAALWIITEADRSLTTILTPDEY